MRANLEARSSQERLDWWPSPHARRCLTLAALALLLGIGLHPALVVIAAAPLSYLFIARWHKPDPTLDWSVMTAPRCFENEPLVVLVYVAVADRVDVLRIRLHPGRHVRVADDADCAVAVRTLRLEYAPLVRVQRWGRRRLGAVTVEATAPGGLRRARCTLELGEVATFPQPTQMHALAMPATRLDQVGDHVARRPGPGVEFAGIRPFAFGDALARINWLASLRTQVLQVTDAAAESAVDVVLVLDCFDDVGGPGRSSLDLTVRGAIGVARVMLAGHDRVGLVALGGWLRWVRPDVGDRQFYRVADAMLDVIGRESYVDPDLSHLVTGTLPPGCVLVVFSPLLDERALNATRALRIQGHPVIVVDVLTAQPPAVRPVEQVALRLWLLDREVTRAELGRLGILVVPWDGSTPLDVILKIPVRQALVRQR